MANESFVGRSTGLGDAGFAALKKDLGAIPTALGAGVSTGILELTTGTSKLKAIWESIKWTALARAGVAGLAILYTSMTALTFGIRKAVSESDSLRAAMEKLAQVKLLTMQFTAFLGNVDAAKRRVGELYAVMANTKFNLGEIAGASKVVTILSQGAEGGSGTLTMLGKVATATGSDLQELATAYGRMSDLTRNNQDISGTVEALKEMGVISEATARRLVSLQQSGASATSVMGEFKNSMAAAAAVAGDSGESVDALQDRIAKLKETMSAEFGKSWTAQAKKDLENQAAVYEKLIPAAAKLGDTLEVISRPAVTLRNNLYEIAKKDWFAQSVGSMAQWLALLPGVTAGYFALKGAIKAAGTASSVGAEGGIKGLAGRIGGAFLPSVASKNLAETGRKFAQKALTGGDAGAKARALLSEGNLEEAKLALEAAERAKIAYSVTGKAAEAGSKGLEYLSKGLTLARGGLVQLGTKLLSVAGPAIALAVATQLASKAWDAWRDSVARAAHAADLVRESLGARSEIDKEIEGLKTLDDKTKLLTKSRQELNDALREQARVRGDAGATEGEEAAAAALVTERRRALSKVEAVGGLGAGSKTMEQKIAQLRIEKEIADIVFQAEFSRASGGKQAIMLAERLKTNMKIVADYQKGEAQAPALRELDEKLSSGREARAIEARGLGQEYIKLIAKAEALKKAIAPAGAERGQLEKQLAITEGQAGQVRERIKTLRQQTPNEQGAEAERRKLLFGPGAAQADRLQEQAKVARESGKESVAQGLELEAIKLRLKSKEDAEKEAAEEAQQLEDIRRQGSLRKAELDVHEKLLNITNETYEAQDEAARAQMAGIERQRALLVDIPANTGDADAQRARQNQIRGFDQQTAELQKEIDDRARDRERERTAFNSSVEVRKQENIALDAATRGHFAEADAAIKAAQKAEDQQADREESYRLLQQGYSEEAAAARVAAIQKQRQSDREATASAYRINEQRRLQELRVEAASVGRAGVLGLPQGSRTEARQQLAQLRDTDTFREQVQRNQQAHLGAEESVRLAFQTTAAQVAIDNQARTPGAAAQGDSLTRVGGGGGFYLGATGDPSLSLQKRMTSLQEQMLNQLQQINDKKVVVK